MKKILVMIMLLISSFSYYGVVDENGERITNLQNIVEVENIIQESVVENEEQQIVEENIVDEVIDAEIVEEVKIQKEQPKEEIKISQNVNTEIKTTQPQDNKQPEVQSVPKQEETSQSIVTESNISNVQTPQQPISDWCIDGGTKHIQGDQANEHGYYSSWDEAYNAYENDTKDWDSGQFKIGQCWCGLYYYWAIQN